MCGLFIFCLGKKMNFTAASQTLSKNFFPRCLPSLSLSLFFLPQIQFPNRCHLLWCSDISWKILMPKPYRPCMLLKHNGHRLRLGSPSAEFPAEPLESSQPPCLLWAAPPGSELLRTLAGSLVLYINSAAALPAAETAAWQGMCWRQGGPLGGFPDTAARPARLGGGGSQRG